MGARWRLEASWDAHASISIDGAHRYPLGVVQVVMACPAGFAVVTVLDGKTPIATVTLTEKDRGKVKVNLSGLSRGVHRLSASYGGSDLVAPSTSFGFPVLVY